jgi:hypothetical protein
LLSQEITEEDIERILKSANTIVALEVIESAYKKYPHEMEKLNKALLQETSPNQKGVESSLDHLISKGLL